MNSKNLLTGLGIAGGVLGVAGGVLNIVQTADQMKNGVKLRNDQLQSISDTVSINVCNVIDVTSQKYADQVIKKILENSKH